MRIRKGASGSRGITALVPANQRPARKIVSSTLMRPAIRAWRTEGGRFSLRREETGRRGFGGQQLAISKSKLEDDWRLENSQGRRRWPRNHGSWDGKINGRRGLAAGEGLSLRRQCVSAIRAGRPGVGRVAQKLRFYFFARFRVFRNEFFSFQNERRIGILRNARLFALKIRNRTIRCATHPNARARALFLADFRRNHLARQSRRPIHPNAKIPPGRISPLA